MLSSTEAIEETCVDLADVEFVSVVVSFVVLVAVTSFEVVVLVEFVVFGAIKVALFVFSTAKVQKLKQNTDSTVNIIDIFINFFV